MAQSKRSPWMSKGSILGWRHENHPVTAPDVFILNVCFTAVKIQNGFLMIAIWTLGKKLAIQWKKSSNIGIWSATLHENSPDGSLRWSYQWRVDFMNNSLDLFVSAFLRQKWCSISSIPIIPLMFHFNSMEMDVYSQKTCWVHHQKAEKTSTMWRRHGPGYVRVTWVAATASDACNAMAGVTWRKKWWLFFRQCWPMRPAEKSWTKWNLQSIY